VAVREATVATAAEGKLDRSTPLNAGGQETFLFCEAGRFRAFPTEWQCRMLITLAPGGIHA